MCPTSWQSEGWSAPRWSPACRGRTPAGTGRTGTRGYQASCSCPCHWKHLWLEERTEQEHAGYLPIPNSEKKSFSETCTGSFHPRRENVMHFSSHLGYWVRVCGRKHRKYDWLPRKLPVGSITVHFMIGSQNTVCHWDHSNTLWKHKLTHQIVHLQQLAPLPSFLLPRLQSLTSGLYLVLYMRI